jgi:hypothetical protein
MATDETRLPDVIRTLGRKDPRLRLEIIAFPGAPPPSGYVTFTMVIFIVIFAAPWANP